MVREASEDVCGASGPALKCALGRFLVASVSGGAPLAKRAKEPTMVRHGDLLKNGLPLGRRALAGVLAISSLIWPLNISAMSQAFAGSQTASRIQVLIVHSLAFNGQKARDEVNSRLTLQHVVGRAHRFELCRARPRCAPPKRRRHSWEFFVAKLKPLNIGECRTNSERSLEAVAGLPPPAPRRVSPSVLFEWEPSSGLPTSDEYLLGGPRGPPFFFRRVNQVNATPL